MKVEIFDPAMCCPTGICGPAVDPALVRMNDAVMMLQRQGVEVARFGLAQQTKVFLENKTVPASCTRRARRPSRTRS